MSSVIYKMFQPNRCFTIKIFAHSIFISNYMQYALMGADTGVCNACINIILHQ